MEALKAITAEELSMVLNELVNNIKPIFGDKLKKVVLFGSYARGDYDAESDIDIMILLSEDDTAIRDCYAEISDLLGEIDLKYDVLLSPIVQSEQRFMKYLHAMPFYANVKKEGVVWYEQ